MPHISRSVFKHLSHDNSTSLKKSSFGRPLLSSKIVTRALNSRSALAMKDPVLAEMIRRDEVRQTECLNLIASENYAQTAVLEALGACLSNKYSHNYPGKRDYKGNTAVDEVENLCRQRSLAAFGLNPAEWGVNVQAFSGSVANFAVFSALLNINDRLMAMGISSGGHPSHGYYTPTQILNVASKFFSPLFYNVDPTTELIDYDKLEFQAKEFIPKIIVAGASAYPRDIDYQKIQKIARSVNAYFMTDIAHTSGLIASKLLNNPFDYSDIVTTTTHKTLNGPRGALIFYKQELAQKIDFSVYPMLQAGGPQNNKTAAIAHQMGVVATQQFRDYSRQVVSNSKAMAEEIMAKGHHLCTRGTDTHLFLWNVKKSGINGNVFEDFCENVNILVNKNPVFGDVDPLDQSAVRIGTPALTSRSMGALEMKTVSGFLVRAMDLLQKMKAEVEEHGISTMLKEKKFGIWQSDVDALKIEVREFSKKFPTPGINL